MQILIQYLNKFDDDLDVEEGEVLPEVVPHVPMEVENVVESHP